MARNKLSAEEKKLAERKARYREAHNRKRREMYQNDPAYRRKVHNQNRTKYRQEHGVVMRKACGDNEVGSYGQRRKVVVGDTHSVLVCLTNVEIADALGGYHKFVLHRWQRADRFPRPQHSLVGDSLNKVFTLAEAKRLVRVMRSHQQEKMYLTSRDTEVIEQLMQD